MKINCFTTGIAFCVCWCLIVPAHAVTIADNFDTSHDYSGGNVAGTIWDGVLFNSGSVGAQNASGLTANANTTNTGRLTVTSTNGGWEGAQDCSIATSPATSPPPYR